MHAPLWHSPFQQQQQLLLLLLPVLLRLLLRLLLLQLLGGLLDAAAPRLGFLFCLVVFNYYNYLFI